MVELNQIKLGNTFLNSGELKTRHDKKEIFNWTILDWYALEECTMFIEDIDPILISEEWLIRFGFKYIPELLGYADDTHYGYLNISKVFDFYPFCSKRYIELKYVHQLQNLYFALTGGVELKIKE